MILNFVTRGFMGEVIGHHKISFSQIESITVKKPFIRVLLKDRAPLYNWKPLPSEIREIKNFVNKNGPIDRNRWDMPYPDELAMELVKMH